jgi:hypothetical protein
MAALSSGFSTSVKIGISDGATRGGGKESRTDTEPVTAGIIATTMPCGTRGTGGRGKPTTGAVVGARGIVRAIAATAERVTADGRARPGSGAGRRLHEAIEAATTIASVVWKGEAKETEKEGEETEREGTVNEDTLSTVA